MQSAERMPRAPGMKHFLFLLTRSCPGVSGLSKVSLRCPVDGVRSCRFRLSWAPASWGTDAGLMGHVCEWKRVRHGPRGKGWGVNSRMWANGPELGKNRVTKQGNEGPS